MNRPLPQRRSPRLSGYDYAQSGAYFVTVCTHQRTHLFGEIDDGVMALSSAGEIAEARWHAVPEHHPGVSVDAFVVMPNHIHAIVTIVGTTPALSARVESGVTDGLSVTDGFSVTYEAGLVPTPEPAGVKSRSLGAIVGSYKSGVTRRIREMMPEMDGLIWQERYHDHIIRNEVDWSRIYQYIQQNPARWTDDRFFS